MMRRGLRQLLEGERGITLTGEAVDLESTTKVVAERQPDVLVLDLTMPDGSAIDILGELRAKSPQTRIVVVTMEDAPGFAQRALAAGAGGFVLKELADEDLAGTVDEQRLVTAKRNRRAPRYAGDRLRRPAPDRQQSVRRLGKL